jgi:preprotein translocase SecE subunit
MFIRIYKPGQGKYTRLGTLFSVVAIVGFGCLRLYRILGATELNIWLTTMIPVVIGVAVAGFTGWLLIKPSVADFLIAAEGELKKVNWSSRKEVAASTLVVIIVVFIMAILLGSTDLVFDMIFRWLLA